MRKPTVNAPYRAVPRVWYLVRPVVWGVWSTGLVALVVGASVFALAGLTVPSVHQFSGTLRPVAAPYEVSLSQGAVFGAYSVDLEDDVRAGQTLLTYDVAAMKERRATFEKSLIHDSTLRDCLRRGGNKKPVSVQKNYMSEEVESALAACAGFEATGDLLVQRLEADLKTAVERREILQKMIAAISAVKGVEEANVKKDRVLKLLSLSLLVTEAEEKIASYETRINETIAQRNADRRTRLEDLSSRIQKTSAEMKQLEDFIEQPRLLAEMNGRVVRQRPVQAGSRPDADQTLLEVRVGGDSDYQATFPVPDALADVIIVGTKVEVAVRGYPTSATPLSGVIQSLNVRDDQRLAAVVKLDDESSRILDDPALGLALSGSDTSARVSVKLGALNPWRMLADEAMAFVQFRVVKAAGVVDRFLGQMIKG